MTCPKCGFVSFAGLEKCKKCGYGLVKAADTGSSTSSKFSVDPLFPEGKQTLTPPPAEEFKEVPNPEVEAEPGTVAPEPSSAAAGMISFAEENPISDKMPEGPAQVWQDELSGRLESFRKRRARMHGNPDPEENFELDFGEPAGVSRPVNLQIPLNEQENQSPSFEIELGDSSGSQIRSSLETLSLEKGEDNPLQIDAPNHQLEDMSLEDAPKSKPMEILVGSPDPSIYEDEGSHGSLTLVPVGPRFLAGIADALILVLGVALFGLIFWRSGGHLSPNPINFAVVGVMILTLIFSYFGIFTALTSTTPGLMIMGFEIRSLHGTNPSPRESCWRAFGILVSMSALMLGFIWAWVDSESLTWHDRMSGTFITLARLTSETLDLGPEA